MCHEHDMTHMRDESSFFKRSKVVKKCSLIVHSNQAGTLAAEPPQHRAWPYSNVRGLCQTLFYP